MRDLASMHARGADVGVVRVDACAPDGAERTATWAVVLEELPDLAAVRGRVLTPVSLRASDGGDDNQECQ